ncbi:MAG TPA: zinc ABC transporter substrate-binding protein [Candidatus Ozemobacteraceae bacterium]|nr:zinc ABC transporter substrate-binding protein [Candidatus Ozemobacteraceae bacterium]
MNTQRRRPGARYISISILFFILSWAGCRAHMAVAQTPHAGGGAVCTVYPVFLLTKELASGTGLPVSILLPAELGCPHHYSLTPADIVRLDRSDVILANGLGFEPFLDRLKESGFENRISQVAPATLAMPSAQSGIPNPHVFTTPSGLIGMIDPISSALAGAVPTGTAMILRDNASHLDARLQAISREWSALASQLRGIPVLVTHESLDYIAKEMGLSVVARFETDDEHQHSALARLDLEQAIRDKHPRAILADGIEASAEITALGTEHGLSVIGLPTLTSGTVSPSPAALETAMRDIASGLAALLPASATSPVPPER